MTMDGGYVMQGQLLENFNAAYRRCLDVDAQQAANCCIACGRGRNHFYSRGGQTDYERTGVCETCNDVLHDRRSTMDQKRTQCVSLTDAGLDVAKDYLAFSRGRRRLFFAEEDAFRRAVRIALNQESLPVARH
eukprot:s27_g47.t1